eukprot:scaffold1990_cov181-Amphora_coffeaeformis.AAC.2
MHRHRSKIYQRGLMGNSGARVKYYWKRGNVPIFFIVKELSGNTEYTQYTTLTQSLGLAKSWATSHKQ